MECGSSFNELAGRAQTDRPNILIFLTDQQRSDCLGCYGNRIIQTPNIDSIAISGMCFENAYVNQPLCVPQRCSMVINGIAMNSAHRRLVSC
jgi:hypothetical protein